MRHHLGLIWGLVPLIGVCFGQFGGPVLTPEANPSTGHIPLLYLQKDGYARTDTWAYYNGTITQDLPSFTICHRYQLWYQRPRMYLFTYAFSDQDANELYSEYHLGRRAFRVCKRGTKFCAWYNSFPDYYHWHLICLTYDGGKDLYKLIVDGEKVESGSWSGDRQLEPVRAGGLLYIGQDQDSLGGGFNVRQSWGGEITQFNIWSWALEEYYIENMAECRSDLFGDILKWDETQYILGKAEFHHVPLFELCSSGYHVEDQYFLFPNKFDFNFYTAWCKNQGGAMAVPKSTEHFHEIMDIGEHLIDSEVHEKCMHASGSLIVWIGLTDEHEEGIWANPYTKEPLDVAFWDAGQPHHTEKDNCAEAYLDRRWINIGCGELACALCHFPIRMNLTMRGLCASETKLMEGFFDQQYFIKGYRNLKPHWRGEGKSHILYMPKKHTWKLESFYDVEKYAEFPTDESNPYDFFPTGRSDWVINSGICQLSDNAHHKMTLTNCVFNDGTGYDFTCTDGTCVPMEKRCNLVDDCPDQSDEKDCELLEIPDDYRRQKFPITESGDAIHVTLNVTILAFPIIDTLGMSYTADFILLMRWKDPRLEFKNLVDSIELNSLSVSRQLGIWSPSLSFPNARQAEGTVVDEGSQTFVVKSGHPEDDNIERSLEAAMYHGYEVPMIMIREYFVKFNCDYDLLYYPFDTQICEMQFQVNGIPKHYLDLGAEVDDKCIVHCGGAEYLGNKQLVEYVVGGTAIDELKNQTGKFSKMMVMTIFKRKWTFHFWTIFLQSILLLLVAYMTFYFKISNFQDRIMIAITTMMVVATIQSSINKMVPNTAYYKMIDYWLLYSFNILIIIMVVHTVMDNSVSRDPVTGYAFNPRLRVRRSDNNHDSENKDESSQIDIFGDNPDWDPGWVRAYRINVMGQVLNVIVFLLFNIVFWSVALTHYYAEVDLDLDHRKKK